MHLKHWEQDGKKLKSQARPKYKKRILKRLKIAIQRIKEGSKCLSSQQIIYSL